MPIRVQSQARCLSVVCVVLALAALAACSSSSAGGKTSNSSGGSKVPYQTEPAKAAGSISSVTWDDPLGEPPGIDPTVDASSGQEMIFGNLCENLFHANPDFSLPVKPGVAESYTHPNATTYVLQLRPGVRFWDGHAVTPADVVFDLERAAHLKTSAWSEFFSSVKSIQATGSNAVTIKLSQPDSILIPLLASPAAPVMESAYIQAKGDSYGSRQGGLMCTGPYKLASWQAGQQIVMTRNPDYWGTPALAKTFTFKFVTNPSTLSAALNSGQIDGTFLTPPSIVGELEKSSAGKFVSGPGLDMAALWGPFKGSVLLSKPALIRALSMVIGRKGLASTIYQGLAIPLKSLNAPSFWEGSPAKSIYRAGYDALPSPQGSISAATALVKQSGYSGQPIVISYSAAASDIQEIATAVQQYGSEIGLNIKLKGLTPSEYLTSIFAGPVRGPNGEDLTIAEYNWELTDPLYWMTFVMASNGLINHSGYTGVQRYLNAGLQETSNDAAAQDVVKAQVQWTKDQVDIPLLSVDTITFQNSRITGGPVTTAWITTAWAALVGAAS